MVFIVNFVVTRVQCVVWTVLCAVTCVHCVLLCTVQWQVCIVYGVQYEIYSGKGAVCSVDCVLGNNKCAVQCESNCGNLRGKVKTVPSGEFNGISYCQRAYYTPENSLSIWKTSVGHSFSFLPGISTVAQALKPLRPGQPHPVRSRAYVTLHIRAVWGLTLSITTGKLKFPSRAVWRLLQ